MSEDEAALRAAVTRLYWESDASVAEIEEKFGLSRRGLYDALEPLAVGMPCPECGGDLVYRTRTKLDNEQAECLECGLEGVTALSRTGEEETEEADQDALAESGVYGSERPSVEPTAEDAGDENGWRDEKTIEPRPETPEPQPEPAEQGPESPASAGESEPEPAGPPDPRPFSVPGTPADRARVSPLRTARRGAGREVDSDAARIAGRALRLGGAAVAGVAAGALLAMLASRR